MSATKLSSKCQSDTDFICVKTVFHKHLNIGLESFCQIKKEYIPQQKMLAQNE